MGISYDLDAMHRLIHDFGCSQAEIGEVWLNRSRQRINQFLASGSSTGTWVGQALTPIETDIVMRLVSEGKTLYNDWNEEAEDRVVIRILRNDNNELAIFALTGEDVKCIFDVPEDLQQLLRDHDFHILEEKDFSLKKEIDSSSSVVDGVFLRIRDNRLRVKFRWRASSFDCTPDQYAIRLGYGGYLHPTRSSTEEIREILEGFLIGDGSNKIAIPIDHYRYFNLTNRANRSGVTLEEYVRRYGFEQVRHHSIVDEVRREDLEDDDSNSSDDKNDENDLLNLIKELSGSLSTSQTTIERKKRSSKLAREMKKLYNYQCQLCDYSENGESVPKIVMANGRFYVEVHHVKEISSYGNFENDEESLDSYGNVIVVCCHHHKVLHYHEGGASTLLFDKENGYHFVSGNGTLFKVYTNKHFIPSHADKTYEVV